LSGRLVLRLGSLGGLGRLGVRLLGRSLAHGRDLGCGLRRGLLGLGGRSLAGGLLGRRRLGLGGGLLGLSGRLLGRRRLGLGGRLLGRSLARRLLGRSRLLSLGGGLLGSRRLGGRLLGGGLLCLGLRSALGGRRRLFGVG